LHVLLFVLTFISAILAAVLPHIEGGGVGQKIDAIVHQPGVLAGGLPFAVTLMAILLAHEMGHYWMAHRHGVDQSLPYFIPAPTIFGTLGALILMRTRPSDRRVLMKVAVAGPFAGLLLAIPAAAWGLHHSSAAATGPGGSNVLFGTSLLFGALNTLFGPGTPAVDLHPVALAAWVGLFVTSLNLIPAAQLDGGHVAYALFGARQERISLVFVAGLLALGILLAVLAGEIARGIIWVFWSLFLFVIGIRHPPVHDEAVPLGRGHRLAGWSALVVFALTFTPVPIAFSVDERPPIEHIAPGDLPDYQGPAEEFRL
jgi:membrane-associated protease RseP (regulator of RpoE activity)